MLRQRSLRVFGLVASGIWAISRTSCPKTFGHVVQLEPTRRLPMSMEVPLELYLRSTQELHKSFWPDVEPKLPCLKDIISAHFGCPCEDLNLLGDGAYAHVYSTKLQTGLELAIRIVLPVRESLKTEAEVATMTSMRGQFVLPCTRGTVDTMLILL